MTKYRADPGAVFRALSNPTRRSVVDRLSRGGRAAVGELSEPFEMALPSFMQHLQILEQSGLIRSWKEGRLRIVEIVPGPLRAAEDWLAGQRDMWSRRLDRLDDFVKTIEEQEE